MSQLRCGWTALLLIPALTGLLGCGDDSEDVTAVKIVLSSDTLPAIGATQQLSAQPLNNSGAQVQGKVVMWTSSAPTVISVNTSNGLITALQEGVASISATVDGVGGTAQLTVRAIFTLVPRALQSVSAGASSVCGLTAAGTAYCWGDNSYGQLGNGTTMSSDTPVAIAGGLTFTSLSVGGIHACGITTAGTTYCWGVNDDGQLGIGTASGPEMCNSLHGPVSCSTAPAAVQGGLTFIQVTAGNITTCALTPSHAAYCWGSGPVGNGVPLAQYTTPVPVSGGLSFASVSPGTGFTAYACGVATSGAGYCWGDNYYGQLGYGSGTGPETCVHQPCSTVPVAVAGGLTFATTKVGIADPVSCGVTTSAAAYCWGSGQLGSGPMYSVTPAAVAGGLSFGSVSPGRGFACGLTTTGRAYCWGYNFDGELGTGNTTPSTTPVPVAGGVTFSALSAGYAFSCGIATSSTVYCWGSNDHGQLGGGSAAPVAR